MSPPQKQAASSVRATLQNGSIFYAAFGLNFVILPPLILSLVVVRVSSVRFTILPAKKVKLSGNMAIFGQLLFWT